MITTLRSRTAAGLSGIAAALACAAPAAADPPTPAEVRAAVATLTAGRPGILAGVGALGTTVAAGDAHTCAATLAGDVWCWGTGADGRLGTGSTADAASPVPVSDAAPLVGDAVLELAAGRAHTCAVAESDAGALFCWGANGSGQLGDGSTTSRSRPVPVLAGVDQIAAGRDHTCALRTDGTVWCWGRDDEGQLGQGTTGGRQETPQLVPGLTGVVGVAAGGAGTCAVDEAGAAWCWGSDDAGQLGDGPVDSGGGTPVRVVVPSGVDGFLQVSVGRSHACAVSDAITAYCWGSDAAGQLGAAGTGADAPRAVAGLPGFVAAIAAAGDSTCATRLSGPPACWGANGSGQLGVGDRADRAVPTTLATGSLRASPFVQAFFGWTEPVVGAVAAGGGHACAVDGDSAVHCWGAGAAGQLGTGAATDALRPVATRLSPAPVTGVRIEARAGALRVTWEPGGDPGAAPIEEYAAFAVRPPGELALCTVDTGAGCTVDGLSGGARYAVFVGARSSAGLSYSALGYAVPAAAGQGAGLPVTGSSTLAGLVLVLAGGLVIGCSRRYRCPTPRTGPPPAGRPSGRPAR